MKKVLVIGGTGAMGTYLVPKLVERGFDVTVTHNDEMLTDETRGAKYIKLDMFDLEAVKELLKGNFDGVVDFMIYDTSTFMKYSPLYLDKTGHYISFSSYRVFADSDVPITENSPQLLNVSNDELFRYSNDYAIHKAKGECFLRGWKNKNWTIVRPAITYSKRRCQLITLERQHIFGAMKQGRPIVLCDKALDVQATMSWAGDVAEMLTRLLFNEKAFGEDFNVTTSEHHTWGEVAEYYKDIFGTRFVIGSEEEYLSAKFDGKPYSIGQRFQLDYDRLFNRVMDNSKVLSVTDMKQTELTSLRVGLERERKTLCE